MDIEWFEKTLSGNIAGTILAAPEVVGHIVTEGLELIAAYKQLKKERDAAINRFESYATQDKNYGVENSELKDQIKELEAELRAWKVTCGQHSEERYEAEKAATEWCNRVVELENAFKTLKSDAEGMMRSDPEERWQFMKLSWVIKVCTEALEKKK